MLEALSEEVLPPHLQNLNPPQLEAARHFTGPILVLAGAGSGKTRVLTRRIANLILEHNVSAKRILAVTFTNKAAQEMKSRVFDLLGSVGSDIWVSTFHSAALRILRRHANLLGFKNDFVVYDDQDSRSTIKGILKELGINEKQYPIASFSSAIDRAKNGYVTPDQMLERAYSYDQRQTAEVYAAYQRSLRSSGAMDFGDLLVNTVALLEQVPDVLKYYNDLIQFLLIDEYQDTNDVQYRFIRLLTRKHNNILVVGDDDQGIYSFRGATIKNILDFERDFPGTKVVKLEQNYRSTAHILNAAHSIIEKNKGRKDKKLWTAEDKGSAIRTFVGDNDEHEADYVCREISTRHAKGSPYSEVAIFYRTNAQSRAFEEALLTYRIPYRIYGGLKFYDRKEIKDVVGYLKLIVNPADTQSFLRVVNTPARGIGEQTVRSVIEEAKSSSLSISEAAKVVGENNKSLNTFVTMMDRFRELSKRASLPELLSAVIEDSGYLARLKADKDPSAESRVENLQALHGVTISILNSENPLGEFLDRVTLSSSADGNGVKDDGNKEVVSLMTLHLAKGLEFDTVFFSGIEEGLIPHYRSTEGEPLEEERRLMYVGVTRARKDLFLTRCVRRSMFAGPDSGGFRKPSRFVSDLPDDVLDAGASSFKSSYVGYDFEQYEEEYEGDSRGSSNYYNSSSYRKPVTKSYGKPSFGGSFSGLGLKSAQDLTRGNATKSEESIRQGSPLSELSVGKRVNHATFGDGTILEIEPDVTLNKSRITVDFDKSSAGRKRLVYQYARLVVVDSV